MLVMVNVATKGCNGLELIVKLALILNEYYARCYYFCSVLKLSTVQSPVSGCKHHDLTDNRIPAYAKITGRGTGHCA